MIDMTRSPHDISSFKKAFLPNNFPAQRLDPRTGSELQSKKLRQNPPAQLQKAGLFSQKRKSNQTIKMHAGVAGSLP
jgi:hypothetical protein